MFKRVLWVLCVLGGGHAMVGCEEPPPTCAEVCSQGRTQGCDRCNDTCEATCTRLRWSPELRWTMYTAESCRYSLGGSDAFAVCDTPR